MKSTITTTVIIIITSEIKIILSLILL